MPDPYAVGPDSTRVFAGFKLPSMDLSRFHAELGATFMPGTPYMQAQMGLNAYVPAVLDIAGVSADLEDAHAARLPDEVALIVYASLDIYRTAREKSLRRRMYTHSHAAVFDMDAPGGVGQFPARPDAPAGPDATASWHLFDARVDWQEGASQLLFAVPASGGRGDPDALRQHTVGRSAALAAAGADQAIVLATPDYAVIWTHAPMELDLEQLDLLHPSYRSIRRTLAARPVDMPVLEEDMAAGVTIPGITIDRASMFTFRFERDPRFIV